jgi:hypothetical protein
MLESGLSSGKRHICRHNQPGTIQSKMCQPFPRTRREEMQFEGRHFHMLVALEIVFLEAVLPILQLRELRAKSAMIRSLYVGTYAHSSIFVGT